MLPLLVAVAIIAADQATKEWVRACFYREESRPVISGFFHFTYVRNTGAAWGMFGSQNTGLLILSVVMLALLLVYRRKLLGHTWDHRLALGLLIGGIVGNMMDRVRLGWVTDFLDFNLGFMRWPTFNIADAAICTGVGIYMLTAFLEQRRADAGKVRASAH